MAKDLSDVGHLHDLLLHCQQALNGRSFERIALAKVYTDVHYMAEKRRFSEFDSELRERLPGESFH